MNSAPFLIACPVCQTKASLSAGASLCMECGWEFLFFCQPAPPLLQEHLKQKVVTQQQFRASIVELEARAQQTEEQQQKIQEQLKTQQADLQALEQKALELKAELEKQQHELDQKPDNASLVKDLNDFLHHHPTRTELDADMEDVICSYAHGEFLIEVSDETDLKTLPRLVLGVSRRGKIPLVSRAECIYLLPTWDKFSKKKVEDSILFRCSMNLPIEPSMTFKFGSYQRNRNSFFNIITKKI